MTCDVARNRLLALPDPAVPSADLLPHLGGCPACRRAQAEAVRLDRLLKRLPVPDARAAKAAVLAQVERGGPVIRSRPVLPSTLSGNGAFRPVTNWLKRLDWRYAGGGIAAAVAVSLTAWGLWPKPAEVAKEPPEKTRSALLAKAVRHTNTLAGTARTPDARMGVYAEWTADVTTEAKDVYKVAAADEMNSLAAQYEQLAGGVAAQATLIDDKMLPPDERSDALRGAIGRLTAAQTDAARLAPDAPPNARPALDRIARSANDARMVLARIADGQVNARTPHPPGDPP